MLGIACVVGAISLLVLQDALVKWLSGDYPLHEIMLVRATSAIVVTLVVMRLEGGIRLIRTRRLGLLLARAGLLVAANCALYSALAVMTIADATAIFFIAPLMITSLSALILREKVGRSRWAAVCVGLVGVIVMMRPGEGVLRLVALLPILAAAAYALMQIITRSVGSTERASTMAFYAQAGFIVASAAMGLVAGDGRFAPDDDPILAFLLRAWTVPTVHDAAAFLGIGVINGIAGYLISQAYRIARPATIAPYEYLALPMAVLWGVVFFGDWPDLVSYAGMGLICAGGLYLLYGERFPLRTRRGVDRKAG